MHSGPCGNCGPLSTSDHYPATVLGANLDSVSEGPSESWTLAAWAGETQVAQFNHGQAGNTKMPMKNTSSAPAVIPRIYVRCLASYNAGILHGAWIDADQDADAIHEEVQAMLAASPEPDAEEWAIHDYEGFGAVRISEYEDFKRVSEIAAFIKEHGRMGLALLEHYCGDLEDAQRSVEDYLGTYASLADYAESTMDGVEIPSSVAPYVDYAGMGRDMEMNGDIFTIELGFDEVLVFVNH